MMATTRPLQRAAAHSIRPLATQSSSPSSPSPAAAAPARPRLEALRADLLTVDDFLSPESAPSSSSSSSQDRVVFTKSKTQRLPSYLKTQVPVSASYNKIKNDLRGLKLHTVCEEARCPNIGQCWGGDKGDATATIMLMGDTCTRGCRFCAIKTAKLPPPLDVHEPENTAEAISRWGVGYIVMTSVDRDDIADGGASHFAETIRKTKSKQIDLTDPISTPPNRAPHILIEALTGDFQGGKDAISLVARSGLDVYAHNMETTENRTPFVRDPRATFRQSLEVLRVAKEAQPGLITKTSIMLGVGETDEEVLETLKGEWASHFGCYFACAFGDLSCCRIPHLVKELRKVNVDVVTFGQYMRPTKKHMKVSSYVTPEQFDHWGREAERLGFLYWASGPLVRSSFKANELLKSVLGKRLIKGMKGRGQGVDVVGQDGERRTLEGVRA